MKFRIHYETTPGNLDFFEITGDTIQEVQEKARRELNERGGKNAWSEFVEEL